MLRLESGNGALVKEVGETGMISIVDFIAPGSVRARRGLCLSLLFGS